MFISLTVTFYSRVTFLEIYQRINVLDELKKKKNRRHAFQAVRFNTEWTDGQIVRFVMVSPLKKAMCIHARYKQT